MNILKRPPGDTFTFRQFVALTSQIKSSKDVFYLWSTCIDPNYKQISHFIGTQQFYETEILYRNIIMSSVNTDLIIIGIKDHLTGDNFNPKVSKYTDMTIWLKQMAQYYSNKKIILFTSLENLEIDEHNVKIIPWGGDITNHQREYQKLQPVLEKNLNSNYTFLSLNRNKRTHRAMLVSLLYGLGIQNSGLISCMFKDSITDLFEYTGWEVNDTSVYLKGFDTLKNTLLSINDAPEIYHNNNNDNVSNFKNKLAQYYQDTFVEIVAETSYTEACYNLTEKTLNSIYGCCFPILLCSPGTVAFLRSIGLDMFDDIIDHGYDTIINPADRLEYAILKNKELLTDTACTKRLWIQNKNRFEKNVDFCRERLYNYYNNRSKNLFKEIINDYNL
tara:strand:- start:1062 stop:2228 length:1167 start_codon:yes stop_codon:yes gene_type:complete